MLTIAREHPVQENLALLHERHRADMHADTPPESIHMLPADALAAKGIAFYVMREAGTAIGMGAIKALADGGGEIKSMHILLEQRGRGLAGVILAHLVSEARAQGMAHLSLETGAQASFAAARGLYERAGFTYCAPFGDYTEDPMSVFMRLAL